MINNITKLVAVLSCVAILNGCKDNDSASDNTDNSQKTNCGSVATKVVVVGMEKSSRYGSCPGAEYDARRMETIFKKYTDDVSSFFSSAANYDEVRAAMERGAGESDLFIFYYSGHGGSQRFYDTGSEESDGQDEFLCLNDRYMRDNDIWNIISKARGRVLLIFDCCHSQTMYKLPKPLMVAQPVSSRDIHTVDGEKSIMCWSGCPDDTYSYGSPTGGKFTNTLLKYFDKDMTYNELWFKIENDSSLKSYEKVQRTNIGPGFGELKVFQ